MQLGLCINGNKSVVQISVDAYLLLFPYTEVFACGCDLPALTFLRNQLMRHVPTRPQLDYKLVSYMSYV